MGSARGSVGCVWQLLPLWSCDARKTACFRAMLQNRGVLLGENKRPLRKKQATNHLSVGSSGVDARLRGRRLGIRCIFCFGLRYTSRFWPYSSWSGMNGKSPSSN